MGSPIAVSFITPHLFHGTNFFQGTYFTVEEGTATVTPSATSPVNTAMFSSTGASSTADSHTQNQPSGSPTPNSAQIVKFAWMPPAIFVIALGFFVL